MLEESARVEGEIEIVSDGTGIAVIGSVDDVERFFLMSGLDRLPSRPVDFHRVWSIATVGGTVAEAAATAGASAGRWVKLTEESARMFQKSQMMTGSTEGVVRAIALRNKSTAKHILEIVTKPGTVLTNPAVLAGAAAVMSQYAMQHQMDEIADYLKTINEKVDDILRGQKNAVLADMIGVDLVIEEAMTIRDQVGRVSEITWSKVQATSQTLARTQAYALRELDAIAEKLRKKADMGDIARVTRELEPQVAEWLAVLARTVQLQEGVSVLELDRVLDASPEELEDHHAGLLAARHNRLRHIERCTGTLLAQMDETVRKANAAVLLNPFDSPAAVKSSNNVVERVHGLRDRLGIAAGSDGIAAKRWSQAAGEMVEKIKEGTVGGAGVAKRLGSQALNRVSEPFRPVDANGDGIADEVPAVIAAQHAGSAVKAAVSGLTGTIGNTLRPKKASDNSANPEAN
ncbi:hypothetical protein [Antiquaquibacter soli]|uniref:Uncharacterized protein n=1 Tax=Antiquaquibacter soli TaxID=3064523 RepID=A0ABT9BPD2_9MICO|nr:hypothetical protein [Protaetiibacter sp. WY-16]MDO7882262.1 hypothetical protein [Protaetiibacter sp. WY-16]